MSDKNKINSEITENIIDTIENPVLDPLYPNIKCGAFTNKQGDILIAHDVPLPSRVLWVEYDQTDDSFSLIHRLGRIQDLGIKMTEKMRENLEHGKLVQIAHLEEKKVRTAQKVTLVIRNY
ncbi:MAG: hypothetical protein ACRBDL_01410 [Alphaproteobacteria bacterium]